MDSCIEHGHTSGVQGQLLTGCQEFFLWSDAFLRDALQ